MIHETLRGTDLTVSRVCLGTMTFGGQVDEQSAIRLVDRCLDSGVNFFDTANVYESGTSEVLLGKALRGRRDKVILADKVRGKMGEGPDQVGLARAAIRRAVDESLARLQTDYIDIYYLHQPDYSVPIDETLAAIDELIKQGKVRYGASSNYSSWQVSQMLCLAASRGTQPLLIAQQMYNLLARGVEQEFLPMAREFGVSLIAYNPLAGGLLTGKHDRSKVAPDTRFDNNVMYQERYWHSANFDAVERLRSIAEVSGRSLLSLSLNWLLHHTATSVIILGASRLEQLDQNLEACDEGPLDPETVTAVDDVWRDLRGPIPIYNR